MNIDDFFKQIMAMQKRFFPEARIIILERFPFYLKARILLDDSRFIEIRINDRSQRQSYALIEDGKRIAGFDDLGSWHLHPRNNPTSHVKITAPSLDHIFAYFQKSL